MQQSQRESAPKPEEAKRRKESRSCSAPKADNLCNWNSFSCSKKSISRKRNRCFTLVKGTGKDGRITKDDAVKCCTIYGNSTSKWNSRGTERKKMSMLRRKVAERLVAVKSETAMLTTFNEVNMQPIFDLRNQFKEDFKAKHGVGLGFMSFFTLAVVRALKMYPDVNSMIDGDFQIKHDFQDISIAVSGPKGLMVPVIRNAENLSFRGVESEVKRLAIKS